MKLSTSTTDAITKTSTLKMVSPIVETSKTSNKGIWARLVQAIWDHSDAMKDTDTKSFDGLL